MLKNFLIKVSVAWVIIIILLTFASFIARGNLVGILGIVFILLLPLLFIKLELAIIVWIFFSPLTTFAFRILPGIFPSFNYAQLFFLITLFAWTIKSIVLKQNFRELISLHQNKISLLILLLGVVSTLWAGITVHRFTTEYAKAMPWSIFLLFMQVFTVIIISDVFKEQKWIKFLFIFMMLSTIIVSGEAIYNFFFHTSRELSHRYRVETTTLRAGFLGNFFVATLPTSLVFLLTSKRVWLKLINLSFLIIVGSGLVVTYSRSAWIAIMVSTLFIFYKINRRVFIVSLILLLIFAIYLEFPFRIAKEFYETAYTPKGVPYTYDRLLEWKTAFSIYLKSPLLGIGLPGYYLREDPLDYDFFIGSAHSNYFSVLSAMGPFGLFLFLLFLKKILKTSLGNYKESKNHFYKSLSLGLAGTFLGLIPSMVFGDVFLIDYANVGMETIRGMIYLWILVGLIFGIEKINLKETVKFE